MIDEDNLEKRRAFMAEIAAATTIDELADVEARAMKWHHDAYWWRMSIKNLCERSMVEAINVALNRLCQS